MPEEPAKSDRIDFWLLIAILVFASFGSLQIVYAVIFHKIALGADGAHNVLEVLVIGFVKFARTHGNEEKQNWLYCTAIPRSTELTAYLVILSATIFVGLEIGTHQHQGTVIALVLVLVSAGINYFFADKIEDHHEGDHNARATWLHLMGDVGAAAAAAVGYLVQLAWPSPKIDLCFAAIAVIIIFVFQREPIRTGRKVAELHKGEHEHPVHLEPGHSH